MHFITKPRHEPTSSRIHGLINHFPSSRLSLWAFYPPAFFLSSLPFFFFFFFFFVNLQWKKIWIRALRGGHARCCSEYGGLHLIESEESPIKIPCSDGGYGSCLIITRVCLSFAFFDGWVEGGGLVDGWEDARLPSRPSVRPRRVVRRRSVLAVCVCVCVCAARCSSSSDIELCRFPPFLLSVCWLPAEDLLDPASFPLLPLSHPSASAAAAGTRR